MRIENLNYILILPVKPIPFTVLFFRVFRKAFREHFTDPIHVNSWIRWTDFRKGTMPGKSVLYPPKHQEFFHGILEQALKGDNDDAGGQRYAAFWILKFGKEFVGVNEIEFDEAREQGKYDDVKKEIRDEPFSIVGFYVLLFYLGQISFYPSGG